MGFCHPQLTNDNLIRGFQFFVFGYSGRAPNSSYTCAAYSRPLEGLTTVRALLLFLIMPC